ncbi:site-2 protease family protein [Nocardioides taihuensis]|uniref:Zinc metalloprotease n=1 Tax=Nocardioides taihuensis TaxID=1835606 RepID=A0ABW0BNP3_9ACTN
MRDSVRLGRVAGFPVSAHWSVGVILLLLAWVLAGGVLPQTAPGHSAATYWLGGLVGSFLLLCSLLAHELAHAVVARRAGVEVEGVTLWLFGGVATFRSEAPSPRDDLRIAVAGPLTSLAVALGSGLAWVALDRSPGLDLAAGVTGWLSTINLVLAVFNMVPGAPLDGGRVLRAVLWARTGDRERAAVSATRAGRAMGYALVGLGLVFLLLGDPVGGVWTVLIGWFILAAANAEQEATVTRTLLGAVLVRDVMSSPVVTADPALSVEDLIERQVLSGRHSAYPVVDEDGRVVGLVTLRQLRTVPAQRRDVTRVRDVVLPLSEVATAAPTEPLPGLLPRLTPGSGRRALVLDEDRLVGIVTLADVSRTVEARALLTHPA